MEIFRTLLIAAYVVIGLFIIILTLMQGKEDEGASGAVMGGASDSFYEKNKGRTKEGMLKRWTIILGITWAVLTVVLGIVYMI